MCATKSDLFEDIAISMDSWAQAVSDAMIEPNTDLVWVEEQNIYRKFQCAFAGTDITRDDIKKVLAECLRGFAVSILTAIDGGTALSEKGRLYLVDEDGNRLGEGLHDDFMSHLLNTKRLPPA